MPTIENSGTFLATQGLSPTVHRRSTHPSGAQDLCVTIEDNGPGIPLESQPHVFDPFYTTKPAGVGTGMGLGIVSRIVDDFGGTIRFSSAPGATLFLVRLPVKQLPHPPQ